MKTKLTHLSVALCLMAGSIGKTFAPPIQGQATPTPEHSLRRDDLNPLQMRVEARIPFSPQPVPSDGQLRLVYEIYLTNMSSKPITVREVRVLDPQGNLLQSARGAEIAANIIGSLQLGSLASVIVFQFLSLADPPSTLDHEVILENSEGTTGSLRLEPSLAVDRRPVVRLGPPILANDLFCDGALANDSYHRRAVITLGGLARIGQRYAIDFEIRKTPTQNYTGDASVNSNYAIYGLPLIAAADGRVVDVVDGIPDNNPPHVPPNPTLREAGGNSVVLDIGDGHFLVYGHMQPGSLKVSLNQQVKKGDQLGLVGNSGNSKEPHLHFQMCDRPSFLASQGQPYVFEGYKAHGIKVTDSLPAMNQVIDFP